MDKLLIWAERQLRPAERWPPFILLVTFAVQTLRSLNVQQFHHGPLSIWIHFVLLLGLTLLLIKRKTSWPWVIGLMVWGSALSTTIIMVPLQPWRLWTAGWFTYALETETAWLLISSQWLALFQEAGSEFWRDPLFLSVMGAAFIGPALTILLGLFYRAKRPNLAVFLVIVVVGTLRFIKNIPLDPIYVLIGVGFICAAVWQHHFREIRWQNTGMDFPAEMRLTNGVAGIIVGVSLVFVSATIPAIPYAEIWEAIEDALTFRRQEAAAESGAGSAGDRANRPEPEQPGPSTLLPTSYLLGNSPELANTPVFEATISGLPSDPIDFHWQEGSFDEYTGFGWARSEESEIILGPGEEWNPRPLAEDRYAIRQTITWSGGPRVNFLLTGQLRQVDQPAVLFVRPNNDLVRFQPAVSVVLPSFSVLGSTQQIDPEQLNDADFFTLAESEFYERYTQLPDNISQRVLTLAAQITAEANGPYDQAKALEAYLRRLPYNLDVDPPPRGREPVDYFLFELQEGYCDYYATSMVVMARSLGLPARLGVGYNGITPDETGRVFVNQDQGHSWAEIYFPGVGWVEFEPTASFPTAAEVESFDRPEVTDDFFIEPAASDVVRFARDWTAFIYLMAVLILGAFAIAVFLWIRRRSDGGDTLPQRLAHRWAIRGDEWAQVQELARRSGFEPVNSDTPREFLAHWNRYLNAGRPLNEPAERFTQLLERERYGPGLSEIEKRSLGRSLKEIREVVKDIGR
ncbi:MAG: transglutaminase domain-containing protein [Ardenticatenaceae bacterium]|nr:transglutaminase domain-containing protein [Ardenticatenaceae bacterium]